MNDRHDPAMSRRAALRLLAGAAASLPLLGWAASSPPEAAEAIGTVAKSAVQYQDHPKGSSFCANCANFIPSRKQGAPGHCTIVAGDISPKGWCLAYAGNG
ncbi:MAG: high-potential iron-sulfur protein [Xanthomonadaceae bacterium]|nr:high-potential iron-sulfur protein [Xanthomonadaceae bacterium]